MSAGVGNQTLEIPALKCEPFISQWFIDVGTIGCNIKQICFLAHS
jgi:hypothetical protein